MTRPRILTIILCALTAFGAGFWIWKSPETTAPLQGQRKQNGEVPAPVQATPAPTAGVVNPPADFDGELAACIGLLDDLIFRWNQTATTYRGETLLEKQRELAKEAEQLGAGDELLAFLDFLKMKGAGDVRDMLIAEIGDALFTGPNAGEAREWLATLEDLKLREALCFQAGRHFTGGDLASFIAAFHPDPQSQSAVLTGYCVSLAQSDPDTAVRTFTELRPSNVDFSGMVAVMAALPPTADFVAISATIPADEKAIARRTRSALLESWAASQPDDAAQYVLSNTELAFPEHMGVVIGSWAKSDPEAAASWIGEISPGKIRDEGIAGLARHWAPSDPVTAWELATGVSDFNKRVEIATAVFKEWEKFDHAGATAAWHALFPPEG